jgi:hypothetical protein
VDVGAVWFRGGVKEVFGGAGVDYGGVVGSVCFGGTRVGSKGVLDVTVPYRHNQ